MMNLALFPNQFVCAELLVETLKDVILIPLRPSSKMAQHRMSM